MDKILIEVFVPVLGSTFDIFIPGQAYMFEILELIKKAVTEMAGGRFAADEDTAICYRENGAIININLSVAELELHNGSGLMLI